MNYRITETGKVVLSRFLLLVCCFLFVSCGYRLVGSGVLHFNSVSIKPVQNETYEPKLEEKMHRALSKEFINQGIEVKAVKGDIDLEATIKTYALGAVAAVDNIVQEQQVMMFVDIKITDQGEITEFKSMRSPLIITFQSTGTVGEAVARQEVATEEACMQVAKELVTRIIIEYAK